MHKLARATAVALLVVACSQAWAATRTDCQPQAIRDLQRLSPQGHAIYSAMRDKKQFLVFVTCDNVQLGLATAVHESVHLLTEQRDAYPLVAGGSIKRVRDVSRFYPPREIARRFASDNYVQTYLRRGAASSADDFMYLLDELNAYSHDLNSSTKLGSLHKAGDGQVDHRAGPAALMSFTMAYVDASRRHHADTWQGLQRSDVKHLVQTLWSQAETVLVGSLGVRGIGGEKYVRFLCDRANGAALGELLGRSPMDPRACGLGGTASAQGNTAE